MVCPICEAPGIQVFFRSESVPVLDNVFWPTREQALKCRKGEIELTFCAQCECIANLGIEPGLFDYDFQYENSLHFSPAFQEYARALAADLVARYRLRKKTIVEIGCGKGEFLAMLCELGENRGIGFDPSYANGRGNSAAGRGITYVSEIYSAYSAPRDCDLICCRHVLEHIADTKHFLAEVRRSAERAGSPVFFEVPNSLYTFREAGIWDIIYPHTFYFVSRSLRRLFESCGFKVVKLQEGFDGQYLLLEALANGGAGEDEEASEERQATPIEIASFRRRYESKVQALARALRRWRAPIVVWGAGSKGVAFLNKFHDAPIEYVVDVNPHKQGKFVPGTGQQVVAPEFLQQLRPGTVIVMNPNYREEIASQLKDLGLEPELLLA